MVYLRLHILPFCCWPMFSRTGENEFQSLKWPPFRYECSSSVLKPEVTMEICGRVVMVSDLQLLYPLRSVRRNQTWDEKKSYAENLSSRLMEGRWFYECLGFFLYRQGRKSCQVTLVLGAMLNPRERRLQDWLNQILNRKNENLNELKISISQN